MWLLGMALAGEPTTRVGVVGPARPEVEGPQGTRLTFAPEELHEDRLVLLAVEPHGRRSRPPHHVGEVVRWEGSGPPAVISLPVAPPAEGTVWALERWSAGGWVEAGGVVREGRIDARVHPGDYALVQVPVAAPAELLATRGPPATRPGCTFRIGDHDDDLAPWLLEVTLSAPHPDGLRWVLVAAIAKGGSGSALFPDRVPMTDALDLRVPAAERQWWASSPVDFSTYPLEIRFPGPRFEDPGRVGAYQVTLGRGPDGWPYVEGDPFGACVNRVKGPGGVDGCAIVSGDCVDEYRAIHAERWRSQE